MKHKLESRLLGEISVTSPTPVFLPGESHGQGSLAGYSPWVLLTDEGCCGLGGASQDYAGFGAMEEGPIGCLRIVAEAQSDG